MDQKEARGRGSVEKTVGHDLGEYQVFWGIHTKNAYIDKSL